MDKAMLLRAIADRKAKLSSCAATEGKMCDGGGTAQVAITPVTDDDVGAADERETDMVMGVSLGGGRRERLLAVVR